MRRSHVLSLVLLGACAGPPGPERNPGAASSDPSSPRSGRTVITTPMGEMLVGWVDVNGLAVSDGDMVIGTVDELTDTRRAAMRTEAGFQWYDAEIPYSFHSSVCDDFVLPCYDSGDGLTQEERILEAIAIWEEATPLRFRPKTAADSEWMRFRQTVDALGNPMYGGPCHAEVGRQSGTSTDVWVEDCSVDTIVHEIGHGIGMFHEQMRADQAEWIVVYPDHVDESHGLGISNWESYEDHGREGTDYGPFDFHSRMLYGSYNHCKEQMYSGAVDDVNGTSTTTDLTFVVSGALPPTHSNRLFVHDDREVLVTWTPTRAGCAGGSFYGETWDTSTDIKVDIDDPAFLCSDGTNDRDASHYTVQIVSCDPDEPIMEQVAGDYTDAGTVWDRTGSLSAQDIGGVYAMYAPQLDNGHAEAGDQFGSDVAIGDFDGDGLQDIAVAAVGEDADAGHVQILKGVYDSAYGQQEHFPILHVPMEILDLPADGRLGAAFAVGDFDGDGYDDLAVGAPGNDADTGRVHVLVGSEFGLIAGYHITLEDTPTVGATQIDGGSLDTNGIWNVPGDELGFALAAGDFDNDGLDDLAVGVPGAKAQTLGVNPTTHVEYTSRHATGVVVLFEGQSSGKPLEPWFELDPYDAGWGHEGSKSGARFGRALAAGDFDGDGDDEIAIGAISDPAISAGGVASTTVKPGAVYVYQHQPGFLLYPFGVMERLEGTQHEARFGWSLAAGNFDGDSGAAWWLPLDDLAVGVPYADVSDGTTLRVNTGAVRVFEGTTSGISSSGTPLLQSAFAAVSTDGYVEDTDRYGQSLAAGDIDRDGYDDLLIGAPNDSEGNAAAAETAGAVYVAGGSSAGLLAMDGIFADSWYRQDGDGFGTSVAIGNVENDGEWDLLVGAPKFGLDLSVTDQGGMLLGFDLEVDAVTGDASFSPSKLIMQAD